MKISIIPKFRSSFLNATEYELQEGENLINYELPKELIDKIRNPPKIINGDKAYDSPDWVNTYNVYLIIKKEN